jgi:hypothetical protein
VALAGAGHRLPIGVEVYAGREPNHLVLWVERARAVVAGDSLADFGAGLRPNPRLRGSITTDRSCKRCGGCSSFR